MFKKRLIKVVLFLIFGLGMYFQYQVFNYSKISDVFYLFLLIIAWISIFFITFYIDYRSYLSFKKWTNFIPTSLGLVMTGFYFVFTFYLLPISEPKNLFSVENKYDRYWIQIDFKVDGSFKLKENSMFSNMYKWGKFKIENNSIYINDWKFDYPQLEERYCLKKTMSTNTFDVFKMNSCSDGKSKFEFYIKKSNK